MEPSQALNNRPSRIEQRRAANERAKVRRAEHAATRARILEMRINNVPAHEVAKILGKSVSRIRTLAKEEGRPYDPVLPYRPSLKPKPAAAFRGERSVPLGNLPLVMIADQKFREQPKITLPYVSILDGVEW